MKSQAYVAQTKQDSKVDPVIVTFSESWFHYHYGIDFSEDTWTDAAARVERNMALERILFDRFGDVGLGSKDPQPHPQMSDAYGNYFVPALFGCEIHYPKDQAPGNLPLDATIEDMAALDVPDLAESPVIHRALEDARGLRSRYGFCDGWVNTGSPLNAAVNIFGEEYLAAAALYPETAQHVLRVIAETQIKLYRELSSTIDPANYPSDSVTYYHGNCPAIMLSPALYRQVILPVDKWLRSRIRNFHLHHCGIFDGFIDIYKELDPLTIEIGGGSDYRAARRTFPGTPFSLLINAWDVERLEADEIHTLLEYVVDAASPGHLISRILVAEVSESISDDTVCALRTAL